MEQFFSTQAHFLKAAFQSFLKDARHFQIVYLSLFLAYGLFALNWDAELLRFTVLISTCLIVQALGAYWKGASQNSWKSAMITALGLSLLLHATEFWVIILAGFLAIATKFLIRFQDKHIFNPANAGIVLTILLTQNAWVSPGQWGSDVILIYFFGAAALMVLLKVGRIDTSLAFLLTLFALEAARTVFYLGWGWDVLFHKFSNGSLLLFTFFMITDPVTTPKNKKARILWGALIAVASFILSQWFYLYTAPIWVLFFAAPLTALFNHYMKGKSFQWISNR